MEIKLYVLTDLNNYVTDYKFHDTPLLGWQVADELEVNEKTFFSKLVDGKFVLDEDKWNEYQLIINNQNEQ